MLFWVSHSNSQPGTATSVKQEVAFVLTFIPLPSLALASNDLAGNQSRQQGEGTSEGVNGMGRHGAELKGERKWPSSHPQRSQNTPAHSHPVSLLEIWGRGTLLPQPLPLPAYPLLGCPRVFGIKLPSTYYLARV